MKGAGQRGVAAAAATRCRLLTASRHPPLSESKELGLTGLTGSSAVPRSMCSLLSESRSILPVENCAARERAAPKTEDTGGAQGVRTRASALPKHGPATYDAAGRRSGGAAAAQRQGGARLRGGCREPAGRGRGGGKALGPAPSKGTLEYSTGSDRLSCRNCCGAM